MDKREWLVDGEIHNGAHFPLCAFTNNARARSAEASAKRALKAKARKGGKGVQSKGKQDKSATAVAEGAKGLGKTKSKNEYRELPIPSSWNEPNYGGWDSRWEGNWNWRSGRGWRQ